MESLLMVHKPNYVTAIRVINNTDQSIERLLVLYKPELDRVKGSNIECIVFDDSRMTVWGIDHIILSTE